MLGKIRIENASENKDKISLRWNIYLDDVDISKFVRASNGLSIQWVNGLPRIFVELIGALELPDEIKAVISVYKEDEAEDEEDK